MNLSACLGNEFLLGKKKDSKFEKGIKSIQDTVGFFGKKIFDTLKTGFKPLIDTNTTKTGFSGLFGEKTTEKQETGFKPLIDTIKKTTGFNGLFGEEIEKSKTEFNGLFGNGLSKNTEKGDIFGSINIQSYKEKEFYENLNFTSLSDTGYKIDSSDFTSNNPIRFYNQNGLYIETFKKNTKFFSSVSKKIYSLNGEAYIYINGHNNTYNRENVLESGYIRAAWLDNKINTVSKKTSLNETTNIEKSLESKRNIFSGYIGPNGEELPEYIVKAVTINYFGKVIKPKLDDDIVKINTDICKTREELIKGVLQKNINISNPESFKSQKEKISKKHKLTALSKAIDEAYSGKEDSIFNPEFEKIISTIKKTSDWQTKIIQGSYKVASMKKKKRNKSKK
ncbi:MAG: hypothetical protein PHV23_01530 [Candidatus Gracilibacteria bacterium]|nr:hypothetical protein [Candidatus Gracilibacteria bacterium]